MSSVSATDMPRLVTVSVVSHDQGALVKLLLEDLDWHSAARIEVILTVNVEEVLPFDCAEYQFPVTIIRNVSPRGFGANHNAAFRERHCSFFCVMNPDIRLNSDPFTLLLPALADPSVAIVAPLVCSVKGKIEDSARRMPTPLIIANKAFGRGRGPDYPIGQERFYPDWVAGMFMLFRSDVYAQMGGFDERYFLYYEDVDLCARLALSGYRIVLDPAVSVTHDARRESHRRFRYFLRHAASISRFFLSPVYFRYMVRRMPQRNSRPT